FLVDLGVVAASFGVEGATTPRSAPCGRGGARPGLCRWCAGAVLRGVLPRGARGGRGARERAAGAGRPLAGPPLPVPRPGWRGVALPGAGAGGREVGGAVAGRPGPVSRAVSVPFFGGSGS